MLTTTIFTLALLTIFLVPGYIYRRFMRRFLTVDAEPHVQETFLAYGVTGLLIFVLTWPFYSLFGFDPFATLLATKDMSEFVHAFSSNKVALLLQVIITPVILAVFAAYIERRAWAATLFAKLRLKPLPKHPTALLQGIFLHHDKTPIVEVTLKAGGKVIYGILGKDSCITSERGHPDLFLEAIMTRNGDNQLTLDETSSGMIILGSQISTLKFFKNPAVKNSTQPEAETANTESPTPADRATSSGE